MYKNFLAVLFVIAKPYNNSNTHQQVNEYAVIYSHNRILHRSANEWTIGISNNMDESHKHVEPRKSDTKEYTLCDSFI